jgi:hypothetical protein
MARLLAYMATVVAGDIGGYLIRMIIIDWWR